MATRCSTGFGPGPVRSGTLPADRTRKRCADHGAHRPEDGEPKVISDSFAGFLVGAVWLPPITLRFVNVQQQVLGVAGGLLLLAGLSVAFESVPRHPLPLYAMVTASWVVALWLYPRVLQLLWLNRHMVPVRVE